MKIGLDVGSTTIKCVVLDDENKIIYQSYERHYSQITEKMTELLTKVRDTILKGNPAQLTVSGSAGMGISQTCNLPFVQEVYATRIAAGQKQNLCIFSAELNNTVGFWKKFSGGNAGGIDLLHERKIAGL